jgi:hypothetical protein
MEVSHRGLPHLPVDWSKMKETDERYTPNWIFDTLKMQFDLDPCSPEGGLPDAPIKQYYTAKDDGLSKEWFGNVWVNPPFSNPRPFMEKLVKHGKGIALVRISQSQWAKDLWNKADGVLLNDKRLKFNRPDGRLIGIPAVTWMFAFGKENAQALNNFTEYRTR